MRLLAVALIASIALVTATGCWLEADETSGSDEDRSELRDYAAAMEIWWLEVSRDGILRDPPLLDHGRILDDPLVGFSRSDPLPSVEPPMSIETLHYLLVTTVLAYVRAEAHTDVCLSLAAFTRDDDPFASGEADPDACRNANAWGHAFDLTTLAWSAELVRLCGGQLESWRIPRPADALAACE